MLWDNWSKTTKAVAIGAVVAVLFVAFTYISPKEICQTTEAGSVLCSKFYPKSVYTMLGIGKYAVVCPEGAPDCSGAYNPHPGETVSFGFLFEITSCPSWDTPKLYITIQDDGGVFKDKVTVDKSLFCGSSAGVRHTYTVPTSWSPGKYLVTGRVIGSLGTEYSNPDSVWFNVITTPCLPMTCQNYCGMWEKTACINKMARYSRTCQSNARWNLPLCMCEYDTYVEPKEGPVQCCVNQDCAGGVCDANNKCGGSTSTTVTTTTPSCVSDCGWVGCSGNLRCEEIQPGCMKKRVDATCGQTTTTTPTTTTTLATTTTTPTTTTTTLPKCYSDSNCQSGMKCENGKCVEGGTDWKVIGIIAVAVVGLIYVLSQGGKKKRGRHG